MTLSLRPLALAAACGPKHHLDQYDFAGQRMALVVIAPPAPGLLESGYRVRATEDVVGAVVQAGATAVKNAEAGRARARLDSATSRMALADALAERTRELLALQQEALRLADAPQLRKLLADLLTPVANPVKP